MLLTMAMTCFVQRLVAPRFQFRPHICSNSKSAVNTFVHRSSQKSLHVFPPPLWRFPTLESFPTIRSLCHESLVFHRRVHNSDASSFISRLFQILPRGLGIAASKLQFPWQQLSWRHRVSSHLPSMISSQSLNIKVTQRDSCCRQDGCWLVLPQVPLDYCATNIKWPAIKETLLPVLPQIRLHRLARGRLILTDRILWTRFSNCAVAN